MKRLIAAIIGLFFFWTTLAQLPPEVKYVEIVSEIEDTMALLNKPDLDKINTAFYRLDCADSLNIINEKIISALNDENLKLDSIANSYKTIVANKDTQIENIKTENQEVISDFEKQIKRANTGKLIWEGTTIVSIIAIIFLAIF